MRKSPFSTPLISCSNISLSWGSEVEEPLITAFFAFSLVLFFPVEIIYLFILLALYSTFLPEGHPRWLTKIYIVKYNLKKQNVKIQLKL